MPRDLYDVLGVTGSASEAEIRHAFWALAKRYHPDVHPSGPDAATRFVEAVNAAETLLDPRRRASYDASQATAGRTGRPPQAAPKPPPSPPPGPASGGRTPPTAAPGPAGGRRTGVRWSVVRALAIVAVAVAVVSSRLWDPTTSSGQQEAGFPANGTVVWTVADFSLASGFGINLAGQGARIQILPGMSADIESSGGELSSAGTLALLPTSESPTYQHCASAVRQAASESGALDAITPAPGTSLCVSGSGGDLAFVQVMRADASGLTANITVWEDV